MLCSARAPIAPQVREWRQDFISQTPSVLLARSEPHGERDAAVKA